MSSIGGEQVIMACCNQSSPEAITIAYGIGPLQRQSGPIFYLSQSGRQL